ncbi:hypothetical protein [Rhodanobacter denitrificans]|uniref:DUF2514 family protein n=1 Tax=Rhodanobacter denitrificans TaxID=666685 RepID=M4NG34_9GAMM|nr:hypothetical protein [Rhodanobacter denitrificans]AGG89910.1 hypothetical protein R2APBS1_2833 [Rhodanobacter denitrificans]UJM85306.1 hypothetical protein LRJ86_11000 [Rhodanobacter denitrificans]
MKYVYALLALLALAVALEWHGHSRGYDDGVAATQKSAQKQVDQANGDRNLAIAERDATAQTLANVQRLLDAKKRELQIANYFADAAMTERAGLQRKLAAAQQAREDTLRKAAHESPDCADLARLPVCPAVAERLWGKTAGAPADARH